MYFFITLLLTLTSCFTPINLTYDSARTLNKGQVEVQGSYSNYKFINTPESLIANNNFGGAIKYGISNKHNLKIRYERLSSTNEFLKVLEIEDPIKLNYIEIEEKIQLVHNKVAIGVPIGYYFNENGSFNGLTSINPRAYFTFFGSTNKFELSLIPKINFLLSKDITITQPAISIGLGLSNNLNKWALRPEVGYDITLSYGLGLNIKL